MPLVLNPQSEPVSIPKWGDFQVQMFANSAYRRVSQACPDPLVITRLETFFAIKGSELSLALQLWGGMLQLCPAAQKPTAAEAQQWEQIASTNAMPIAFDNTGNMQIRA